MKELVAFTMLQTLIGKVGGKQCTIQIQPGKEHWDLGPDLQGRPHEFINSKRRLLLRGQCPNYFERFTGQTIKWTRGQKQTGHDTRQWMALCNLGNLFRIYLRQLTEGGQKSRPHTSWAFDWSGPFISGFWLDGQSPTLFILWSALLVARSLIYLEVRNK